MATVTISSKYQIVIPKELRRELKFKPGQKLRMRKNKAGGIIIEPNSIVDQYYGSMKGAWGVDSDKYLRELRDEWER